MDWARSPKCIKFQSKWRQGFVSLALLVLIASSINATTFCSGVCKCGMEVHCECSNNQQEVIVPTYQVPGGITNLTINNCQKVTFERYSIRSVVSLRYVNLLNIDNLHLLESSLEWDGYKDPNFLELDNERPRVEIKIEHSTVRINSYAIKGQIRNIVVRNCTIKNIKSFGISALHGTNIILIENSAVEEMEIRAIRKFTVHSLILKDTVFPKGLTSTAINDLTITQLFHVSNCYFNTLKTSAFGLIDPVKVEIINTTFTHVQSEAFRVKGAGDVAFENNLFHHLNSYAFYGFRVNEHVLSTIGKREFLLETNRIDKFDELAFYVNRTSFTVTLLHNRINQTCACDNREFWRRNLVDNVGDLECVHGAKYAKLEHYLNGQCNSVHGSGVTTFLICALLFLVGVAIFVIDYNYRRRPGRWKSGEVKNRGLPVVLPDSKTYQINVIVEQAELLDTPM